MTAFDARAFADDQGRWFRNAYDCPCGCSWTDEWSCTCDDDCPECGTTCEASASEDLSEAMRAEHGWPPD